MSQAEPFIEVFRRADDAWRYQTASAGQQIALDDRGLTLDVDMLYRSGLAD